MKIIQYDNIEPEKIETEGAQSVSVRWLISEKDGAPNFAMRLFELEPEGFTPRHQHEWEHEGFILEGRGEVYQQKGYIPVEPGMAVFIKPDEFHQFRNTGSEKFIFLCLIPLVF